MPERIRILLADDHETVREGLKAILSAEPDFDVVAEVDSGTAAIAQVEALNPAIVVMDVSMPGMNGLAATQAIVQSHPGSRVVVLTRHSERAYLLQLLRVGASGYVLKQSRSTSLISAIRAVARGNTYVDPAATNALIGDIPRPQTFSIKQLGSMTSREEEVLRRVAWGFSNKEIAADLDVSVKTIETHKTNVMQKLALRNRSDVIRFALALGWLRSE